MQLQPEKSLSNRRRLGCACAFLRVTLALAASGGVVGVLACFVSALSFPFVPLRIDVAAGEASFHQKCSSCHSLKDGQASYGPSLKGIGASAGQRVSGMDAEEYIFTSI